MDAKPVAVERKLFSTAEVAQMAGVSEKHIRNLIDNDKINTVFIGRCVRVPESEVNRIMTIGTNVFNRPVVATPK